MITCALPSKPTSPRRPSVIRIHREPAPIGSVPDLPGYGPCRAITEHQSPPVQECLGADPLLTQELIMDWPDVLDRGGNVYRRTSLGGGQSSSRASTAVAIISWPSLSPKTLVAKAKYLMLIHTVAVRKLRCQSGSSSSACPVSACHAAR